MITEVTRVQASSLPYDRDQVPATGRHDPEADRTWHPASELFDSSKPPSADSALAFFRPASYLARWLCRRCGSPLAYGINAGILPGPAMLDIWLGTVDREDLQHEYMKPERVVWCHCNIPCIRELTRSGAGGVPEHTLTSIDKVAGDDYKADLERKEKLRGLRARSDERRCC